MREVDALLYAEIARRRQEDVADRSDVLSMLVAAERRGRAADDGPGAPRRDDHAARRRPRDDGDVARLGVHPHSRAPRGTRAPRARSSSASSGRGPVDRERRAEPRVPRRDAQGDAASDADPARRRPAPRRARLRSAAASCPPGSSRRRASTSRTAGRTCGPSRSASGPSASSARTRARTTSCPSAAACVAASGWRSRSTR